MEQHQSKIIILGGGMVGSAIARDLKQAGFAVTVADDDTTIQNKLASLGIDFVACDATDCSMVHDLVQPFDLAIGAVPGFLGYRVVKTLIQAGKNVVDISFMPEDPQKLNQLAKQNDVTVIPDAGVAPGLSNLMFGWALANFETLDSAKCFVGGLPQNPKPPWWYKSVFSPIDVIEEYTRPARIMENGKIVTKPAMTEIEPIEFEKVGTLDAFNSDGLRTLLDMPIPNMIEKTMRFPGHIQKIIELRDSGKLSQNEIENTAQTLIGAWKPKANDFDQTIMRLEFTGLKNGKSTIEIFDMLDYFDRENKVSSMARTTGYTCTAITNLLLTENLEKGIVLMEKLGQNQKNVDFVLSYINERNIHFKKKNLTNRTDRM